MMVSSKAKNKVTIFFDTRNKFKKNINFLDRPLFIPSRARVGLQEYSDGKGYEIKCPTGLPVAHDIDVLNYLLYLAQYTHKSELKFSRMGDLLKALHRTCGKHNYTSVQDSINRWSKMELSFKADSFYLKQGKGTTIGRIHILTLKGIGKNGVIVKMNDDFLELNNRKFSKVIPVQLMERLTPYSKRVFEILSKNEKNFNNTQQWRIGFGKFRLKVPVISEKEDYRILASTKKAVKEINSVLPSYKYDYQYDVERDVRNRDNLLFKKEDIVVRSSQAKFRNPIDDYDELYVS